MKTNDLRNLTKEELIRKEKELNQELFKLNQQRFAGRVEKPHLFKLVRKDIARIKTLLNGMETKNKTEDKI